MGNERLAHFSRRLHLSSICSDLRNASKSAPNVPLGDNSYDSGTMCHVRRLSAWFGQTAENASDASDAFYCIIWILDDAFAALLIPESIVCTLSNKKYVFCAPTK